MLPVEERAQACHCARSNFGWCRRFAALSALQIGQFPELSNLERVTGIEPVRSAWEADRLPLHHTRPRVDRDCHEGPAEVNALKFPPPRVHIRLRSVSPLTLRPRLSPLRCPSDRITKLDPTSPFLEERIAADRNAFYRLLGFTQHLRHLAFRSEGSDGD